MENDELFDYFVDKAGDAAVPYFELGTIDETYFAFRGTITEYTEFILSVARHLEMYYSTKVELAMCNVVTYTAAGHDVVNVKHYVFKNLRTRKITVSTLELEDNNG